MLMHAIAHGGLYGHRKEVFTGTWLWEKKNPLLHQGLEPVSVVGLAFQSDAVPTELSLPLRFQPTADFTEGINRDAASPSV